MPTKRNSRTRRIIAWLRETWDEVDYAQRRMIELQMGMAPRRTPANLSTADDLEAAYRLPAREPEHGLE
jgi:hypothetical protein